MFALLRLALAASLVVMMPVAASGQALSRSDLAKLGKAATVFVQASNNRAQATAFCIHPAGYFVTNHHVVREDSNPTLVLHPARKNQKVVHATVVRSDSQLDLALLRVTGEKELAALTLGSDEGLTELSEVVAFGYPFGTVLAGKKEYPAISVNVGSITSLRQKAGELDRIQLDAVLNYGNSGGPVLDKQGKVVGVVVGGVPGAGVNFAIPVSHLSRFLARPEIAFQPPRLRLAQIHEPVAFQARAVSLLPNNDKGFTLELRLFADNQKSRNFKMGFKDGVYRVSAAPAPETKGPRLLELTAVYEHGTVSGQVEDRSVAVAGRTLHLSELRRVSGQKSRIINQDGKVLRGELKNLQAVPVNLGSETVTLDLTKAREVRLTGPGGLAGLGCTLVAFQEGKEVGRLTSPLIVEGLPAPGEDIIELDIEPPVLAQAMETRVVPSAIKDVVCAGGGRYLILDLARAGKLAIFDVNEAKIVKELPAPEDVKIAAGLDKLVIALPGSKILQRWDLNTFKLEKTAPLDLSGELLGLAMGSASQGPIVAAYREGTFPLAKFSQFTLDKLERRNAVFQGPLHPPQRPHLRASADGKTLGMWSSEVTPSGVAWVKWEGQQGNVSYEHNSRGYVVPGPFGKELFTGMGMLTALKFPMQATFYTGSDHQGLYLPAVFGDYYMHLGASPPLNGFNPRLRRQAPAASPPRLTIYKRGFITPILKRPDIELPSIDLASKDDLTFDKRVYLIPQANLLIVIPNSNDRLVLYRIDVEEALQKAGGLAALQVYQDARLADGAELVLQGGRAQTSGQLSLDDPKDSVRIHCARKLYTVRLDAGKTYQIDLESTAFDAFLRLEDASGQQLAQDDDSGGGLNARITHRCATTGVYRIIATSNGPGNGDFLLTVQQR